MTVIETQYLPCIPFGILACHYDLYLEAHENYQKRSYRNRALLYSSHGVQALSVPLRKGKNNQLPIREVKIAYDEDWPRQHLAIIQTCYGNAPFYSFYIETLRSEISQGYEYLWDLNASLIRHIMNWIGLDEPTISTQYVVQREGDYRNVFLPHKAISLPPYAQTFEDRHGFIPGLSLLDLLFHLGPEAYNYLSLIELQDLRISFTS